MLCSNIDTVHRDRKRAQLIDSIFDHPRYAHVIIIINVVAKRNCLLPELYARKIMNKVKKVISLILESPEYLLDTPRNTITLSLLVHSPLSFWEGGFINDYFFLSSSLSAISSDRVKCH